jgi:putative addiction module component (TIGR02574 family)
MTIPDSTKNGLLNWRVEFRRLNPASQTLFRGKQCETLRGIDGIIGDGSNYQMMPTYDDVLAHAVQLPIPDRIQLLEAIADTIPDDPLPPLSEEWLAEIKRRSAEFDSGAAKGIPWEGIRQESIQRFGSE